MSGKTKIQIQKKGSVVIVKIPGRKPVHVDDLVLKPHRPKTRPKTVSPEWWEKSKCKLSPTGSHYFRRRVRRVKGKPHHIRVGKLWCIFCHRYHSAIYPPVKSDEEVRYKW